MNAPAPKTAKVSEQIANFLEAKGITHAFGIVGAGNVHIFDSIHEKGYTKIICTHHEQAAVMAATTYYRTKGELAAAIVTTGGGSTNAVTGVVSAFMDSIPVLIISGNENSKHTLSSNPLRIWGVQGYDSAKMVEGTTKLSARVLEAEQAIPTLEKAVETALEPRTGPVWIDIPMNIQAMRMPFSENLSAKPRSIQTVSSDLTENIDHTLRLLSDSQRPLLWLGHGIRLSGAVPLIEPLLKKYPIPTLVSWAGIDMIDSDHPLVIGRAGVYGQRAANFALQNSDFVLAVGTRLALPQVGYALDEFAPRAKIVSVDIEPNEARKHGERVSHPVVADAKLFMQAMLDAPDAIPSSLNTNITEWREQCNTYQKEFPWVGPEHEDTDGYINSYPFMEKLCDHLKNDQVIVTDMGTALLSGHQVLKIKAPQRLMTSTGLGEMGFGLPGAIGASFARDRGEVLCLNCDGGMMMNLQELQTVVHYKLPIKIVVFNNDGYLMIKHTQNALFKGRWTAVNRETGVSCPDFSALAKAFGIPAYQINTWEDFDKNIPKLQQEKGPAICEVRIHPEQKLVPKLALASKKDGTYVSPPLEDLSPFISRESLKAQMLHGLHPKSEEIEV